MFLWFKLILKIFWTSSSHCSQVRLFLLATPSICRLHIPGLQMYSGSFWWTYITCSSIFMLSHHTSRFLTFASNILSVNSRLLIFFHVILRLTLINWVFLSCITISSFSILCIIVTFSSLKNLLASTIFKFNLKKYTDFFFRTFISGIYWINELYMAKQLLRYWQHKTTLWNQNLGIVLTSLFVAKRCMSLYNLTTFHKKCHNISVELS